MKKIIYILVILFILFILIRPIIQIFDDKAACLDLGGSYNEKIGVCEGARYGYQ
ncbi:MAG: hypothetical protein SPE78_02440 [Actinobacillus minor]|nr:hypothetical protein [Actinobacillus minor]